VICWGNALPQRFILFCRTRVSVKTARRKNTVHMRSIAETDLDSPVLDGIGPFHVVQAEPEESLFY
jgi:hypothetical protein